MGGCSGTFTIKLLTADGQVAPNSLPFISVEVTNGPVKCLTKVVPFQVTLRFFIFLILILISLCFSLQLVPEPSTGVCTVTYTAFHPGFVVIKPFYKGVLLVDKPQYVLFPNARRHLPLTLPNKGNPFGIAFARGSMFVSDVTNHLVLEYPPHQPHRTFKSGLNKPRGLDFTYFGDLLVADGDNNRVLLIPADGREKLFGSRDKNADRALDGVLAVPRQAIMLPDETILICDTNSSRLQIFDKAGKFLKKVGKIGDSVDFQFPLSAAVNPLNKVKCDFKKPNYVIYDSQGNLFVSELYGNCVKVFSQEKEHVATLGKEGQVGDTIHHLNEPRGIAFAPDGTICITDHNNFRIQFFLKKNKQRK